MGIEVVIDSGGLRTSSDVDHDQTTNFVAGKHFLQSAITEVGTVATGNVDAVVSAASTSTAGKVELATAAEINTGTDTARAIPIDQYVASNRNIRYLTFPIVKPTVNVTTGTNLFGDWTSPIAGTILQSDSAKQQLMATTTTAGTTGTMVVDVKINGTSIMTTNKLDIETTEKTTETAATQPDLTTTALAVGDVITIDVVAAHTTAAKGLMVHLAIREG